MVEHVVPHLVRHHRLDLGQRAAVEQVVVEGDALGAEEPGDVGGDAGGLARGVEHEDVGGRDAVGAGQAQDRVLGPSRR